MQHLRFALAILFSTQSFASSAPEITVFTQTAKPQQIFKVLTFPARVESKVNAVVRSESDGAVTEILKPLGSHVNRGETVAILRHTDPVYEYAPVAVVSSVSGVISDVAITKGSLVNKGDAILTITDPAQLRIKIEVTALDLNFVHRGLSGDLLIPGRPTPVAIAVSGVSPAIDPMLGTATAELTVISKKAAIASGMVGRVEFQVNRREGFLLPDYSIVYQGDKTFVRLVKDGKASKVPVQLGERNQGQVEVVKGLSAEDVVINRASRFVNDGAIVKVDSATAETKHD